MTTCVVCGRVFDQERHSYEAVCEDCQLKAAVRELTVGQALANVRRGCGGTAEEQVLRESLARLGEIERAVWDLIHCREDQVGVCNNRLVRLVMDYETQAQKRACSTHEASL